MNTASFSPSDLIRVLRSYPKHWMVPLAVCTVLALGFALLRPATWEATQTLVLRDEAVNAHNQRPGRFSGPDEMKLTQETIIEVARSRSVLTAALDDVGPADESHSEGWPSEMDVEDLRDAIKITPPNGTEFGKTEIFYLKVKDRSRNRAVALASAISKHLQAGLGRLRETKAQSMTAELSQAVNMAQGNLDQANARLTRLEAGVGADLAELRMLNSSGFADSDLRRRLNEIENEMRQTTVQDKTSRELLSVLEAACRDKGNLLAAPNQLLNSQPALRRLKDGLVDAQIRTATLMGSLTKDHPKVMAAKTAEEEMGQELHNELDVAIRGVKVDISLSTDRLARLTAQKDDIENRLKNLAASRADYAKLVAEVQHRTTLVEQARANLAAASASGAGAESGSLVAIVDLPTTGSRPVGPSKSMIVIIGMIGGTMIGGGVLFLTVPQVPSVVRKEGHAVQNTQKIGAPLDANAVFYNTPGHGVSLS